MRHDIPYLSECGVLCRLLLLRSYHNLLTDKRNSSTLFLYITLSDLSELQTSLSDMRSISIKALSALLTMLFLGLFISCSTIPDDTKIPEIPEVSDISPDSTWVTFKPELEFGEEPLVKSSSNNDLYVVGVTQIIPSETYNGSKYTDYYLYAWGYFDNLDLAVFKLSKMYKYTFVMAYIPNGKNLLYKNPDGTYGHPCSTSMGENAIINNIIYGAGSENNWPALEAGTSQAKNVKSYLYIDNYWNNIERYQGVVERFDPSLSSTVNIKLYRMMIAFKITVEDFTKGHIEIRGAENYSYSYKLYPSSNSNSNTLEFEIETPNMPSHGARFNNLDFNIDNYTDAELEEFIQDKINYGYDQVHISYIDEHGDKIALYTKYQFNYKRNTKYTLSFSLSEAIANGGITPEIVDDGEMEEAGLPL